MTKGTNTVGNVERESLRDYLGAVMCVFGLHSWEEPRKWNRGVVLSGERRADGSWDHEVREMNETVWQRKCRYCPKIKEVEPPDA